MPHSKRSGGTLAIPGDSTPATLELCNPGHHVKLLLIVSLIPNEHATVEQLQLVPGIPLSVQNAGNFVSPTTDSVDPAGVVGGGQRF